ncbi:hypothetical protein GCM10009541_01760 [Micromonospora gifhornensis]
MSSVRVVLFWFAARRIWRSETDRVRFTTGRAPGELAGDRSGRPAKSDELAKRISAAPDRGCRTA